MAIRPIVVGNHGGMGLSGLGGHYMPDPNKKFTSAECLQAAMDQIQADPSVIRNHVQLMTSDQTNAMRDTFWPALFDAASWTRVATHRPTKDDEGNTLSGTDLEVREYENDVWVDEGKVMTAEVATEFGEIKDIKFTVKW